MIAVRRLPRQHWEAELKHYQCYPAEGLTSLNSGVEWWRYPWGGHPFIVPVDDEGSLFQQDFDDIIGDMMMLADQHGWEFPEEN